MHEVAEFRIALTVEDFDRAVAFYRDAVGFNQIADWSSDDGRVVVLNVGRATLELLDETQAGYIDRVEVGRRVAGTVRFALEVDDVDAVATSLVAAGAAAEGVVVDTPWQDRNVRLRDPEDMQLTLFTSHEGAESA